MTLLEEERTMEQHMHRCVTCEQEFDCSVMGVVEEVTGVSCEDSELGWCLVCLKLLRALQKSTQTYQAGIITMVMN